MQRDIFPVDIIDIEKNARGVLRVSLSEFRGVKLINLRIWFEAQDGERRPGRDGVALRIEKLPGLIQALQRAEAEARARGLLPKGGTP